MGFAVTPFARVAGGGRARWLAILACALMPALATATTSCGSYDFAELMRQAQQRGEAYGWLAGLADSCWKTAGKQPVQLCFQFYPSQGPLSGEQTIDGKRESRFVFQPSGPAGRLGLAQYGADGGLVAHAEMQIQPSGEIVLVEAVGRSGQSFAQGLGATWTWRRLDHDRFEIVLQTHAHEAGATPRARPGSVVRWVFKRTHQIYGACANGAR